MPSAAEWVAFFFGTPRRFLTTLAAFFLLVCAIVPGVAGYMAHNLAALVGPLMVLAIVVFGFRIMLFGWPRGARGGRGGGGHP